MYYDWQFVAGKFDEDAKPRGPKWLRDALGPDVFDTVVIVTIEGDNVDDEFLENVGKLHGVEKVDLVGHAAPDLTPAGMAQLRTLPRLKTLNTRGGSRFLAGSWPAWREGPGFAASGCRRPPSRTTRWRSSAALPTWNSCNWTAATSPTRASPMWRT